MSADHEQAIAVLGAGSWGTALAVLLATQGTRTLLWGRDGEQLHAMAAARRNEVYLPGIELPPLLQIEGDLRAVLAQTRDLLIVVPSAGFRATLTAISAADPGRAALRLAWGTKGLVPGTGKLLHQIVEEIFPQRPPMAVISGPTFAGEVASGLPTAVTLAASDPEFCDALCRRLHGGRFRVYTSQDIIGVEVGGAVKNVLAIAAGIADGLGFGANTRAALITRGLSEMSRLGGALGGQAETFMGLAGLGDLVLTCTDNQSRNRRLGLALGRGQSLTAAVAAVGKVVEGVQTAHEIRALAERVGVEMPIATEVCQVLHEGKSAEDAVKCLLAREQKAEAFG